MRILFVNSIGSDVWGGGEKWMVTTASGLIQRGHQAWVGCRPSSCLANEVKAAGVPLLELPVAGDINPRLTNRLLGFLRSNSVDVLVLNLMKDIRTAGPAGRMAGTPLILSRQGLVLCSSKLKYRLSFALFTDGMIVNSSHIRNTYLSYGWFRPERIHTVHNGIALPPLNENRQFGSNIVLSAGRLDPQKGYPILLKAASIARTDKQPWQFVIAGEGPQRQELESRIEGMKLENVRLIGFQRDIRPHLERAALLALPSLFEGMPNVVMEAMAAGKPVVATDLPGTRDLVIQGETGLLVPVSDAGALYAGIRKIMDSPSRAERMGEAGRERIARDFTISQMLDRLESVFARRVAR